MARMPSPFYADPNIERIASNVAKLFSDPDPSRAARARYYGIQAAEAQRQSDATSAHARRWLALQGRAVRPDEVGGFISDWVQMGKPPSQAGDAFLVYSANSGQPDATVARAFVGSGKSIGKDQGFSIADREAVAGRENRAALQRTSTSAGIAAGASRANNADAIAAANTRHKTEMDFKERTRFDKTDTVAPGHAVFPHPDNPAFRSAPAGFIPAPKQSTFDEVKGRAFERYLSANPGSAGAVFLPPHNVPEGAHVAPTPGDPRYPQGGGIPAPKSQTPSRPHTLSPGAVLVDETGKVIATNDKAPPQPMHITPKELDDIELGALRDIGATTTGSDGFEAVHPDFLAQHAQRRENARSALAMALRMGRNAQEARLAYMRELAIEPGAKFERDGWFGSRRLQNPSGATAPPASPPAGQRVPGQVYQTPRGPMKWTGTGWVPAGQ